MLIEEVVSTIGFPIAVTLYLLYERDKTTKSLIKTMVKVEKALIKLEGKLNGKI